MRLNLLSIFMKQFENAAMGGGTNNPGSRMPALREQQIQQLNHVRIFICFKKVLNKYICNISRILIVSSINLVTDLLNCFKISDQMHHGLHMWGLIIYYYTMDITRSSNHIDICSNDTQRSHCCHVIAMYYFLNTI